MITLITGVNGAGKTLHLIAALRELNDRQIYYNHIDGVQVSVWHEITDDQVVDWQSLPDGVVIAVDEAHRLLPQRTRGQPPEFIARLDEHRHRGFDFYFVTQHPRKLDVEVRRLCGRHWHFERKFGAKVVRRLEWQRACDDVQDRRERHEAITTTSTLDKSIFELYHSAEIHTHRFKLPPKVAFVAVGVVAMLVFVVMTLSQFTVGRMSSDPVDSAASPTEVINPVTAQSGSDPLVGGVTASAATARRVPDPTVTPVFVPALGGYAPSLQITGYQEVGPVGQSTREYFLDVGGARVRSTDLAFLGWSIVPVHDCLIVARLPGGGEFLATCATPAVPDYRDRVDDERTNRPPSERDSSGPSRHRAGAD